MSILYDVEQINRISPYYKKPATTEEEAEVEPQDEGVTEDQLPHVPTFYERYGSLTQEDIAAAKETILADKTPGTGVTTGPLTAPSGDTGTTGTDVKQLRADDVALIQSQATEQRQNAEKDFSEFRSSFQSKAFLSDAEYQSFKEGEKTYQENLANIAEAEKKALAGIESFYSALEQTDLKGAEFWGGFRQYVGEDEQPMVDEYGQPLGFFEDVDAAKTRAIDYRRSLETYKSQVLALPEATDQAAKDARTNQLAELDRQLAFIAAFEANPSKYMGAEEKAKHMPLWQKSYKAWQKSPWYVKWTPLAGLPAAMANAPKPVVSALEWWHSNVDEMWGSFLWQAAIVIAPFTGIGQGERLLEDLVYGPKPWTREAWQEKQRQIQREGYWGSFKQEMGWDELYNPFTVKGRKRYGEEVPEVAQFAFEFLNPVYWVAFPAAGKVAVKGMQVTARSARLMTALPEGLRAIEYAAETGMPSISRANPYVAAVERYLGWTSRYPAIAQRLPAIGRMLEPITPRMAQAMVPIELSARATLWAGGIGSKVGSAAMRTYMLPWTTPLKVAWGGVRRAAPIAAANVQGRLTASTLSAVGRAAQKAGWAVRYLGEKPIIGKMPEGGIGKLIESRFGQLEPAVREQITRFVEKARAPGKVELTPAELKVQETYGKQIETIMEEVRLSEAPVHAAFEVKGIGTANKGVTLYPRDMGELWTLIESGTTAPTINARYLQERVWIEEAAKGGIETAVYGRGEFLSPSMPLKGKIAVSPTGVTVYSSEGLGKTALTVISESDILQGIKPRWASESQWFQAQQAFKRAWEQDQQLIGEFLKNPVLPTNAEMLNQRFAVTRWRQAATLVAKTPGGKSVIGALNKSAIEEDVVSRAAILWADTLWRGQAYRTAQMMRLYQIGRSTEVFGIRMVRSADASYPVCSKVKLKPGFTEGQAIRMADGTETTVTTALGDVLQWKPSAPDCPYLFNARQKAYIEELHAIHEDMFRFVEKERQRLIAQGMEDTGPWLTKHELPESLQYVHRTTHGKVGTEQTLVYVGGRKVGSLASQQHGRIYEFMQDGANAGIIYGREAEEYMSTYIDGCFKIVADQRMAFEVQPLGETMAEAMERMYPGLEDSLRIAKNKLSLLGGGSVTIKGQIGKAGSILRVVEHRGIRNAVRDAYESGWMRKGYLNQIERHYPNMMAPLRQMMRQVQKPQERELVKLLNVYKRKLSEVEARLKGEKMQRAAVEAAYREKQFTLLPPIEKLKATLKVMNEDLRVAFHESVDKLVTQAGDDVAKADFEYQTLKETIANDPVYNYRAPYGDRMKKVKGVATGEKIETKLVDVLLGRRYKNKRGEWVGGMEVPEHITKAQFKKLKGHEPPPSIVKKDGKVDPHDALDEIADNLNMTTDELIGRVNQYKADAAALAGFETDLKTVGTYIDQLKTIEDVIVKSYPEGKKPTGWYEPLAEEAETLTIERPSVQWTEPKPATVEGTEKALGVVSKAKAKEIRDQILEYIDAEIQRASDEVKDLEKVVKTKKEIVSSGAGQRKVWVTEQPAFRGRMFEPAVADAIRTALANDSASWLRTTSQAAGVLRTAVAALDFSAPFIQGLPILGIDMANAMQGKPTFVWLKATARHYQAFGLPVFESIPGVGQKITEYAGERAFAGYLLKNQSVISEMTTRYGGHIGGHEYFEAMADYRRFITTMSEKAAAKGVPLSFEVGSLLDKGLMQTYGRAERAFGAFGDAARIEMYKALKPITKAADMYDMTQMLNLMTGVSNSKGLGIGIGQRQIESAFIFFAPRYTRAGFALCASVFRGGIRGEMARKSVAGYLGGGMLMYLGTCKALGVEPQLDPRKATFLSIRVGNQWIGPGGFYTWALRFMSNVIYSGVHSPHDFWTMNRKDNPFLKAFYAKLSPLSSLGAELATKRNYIGEPIETRRDYAELLISHIAPIMLQNVLVPEDRANFPAFVAGVMGMRTFPRSIWEHLSEMRNNAANAYLELNPTQIAVKNDRGYLMWDDLTWMQKHSINETDKDLKALTDEAMAQSIERGNAYQKRVEAWRADQDKIKADRKAEWATITAEYEHNMALKERLDAGDPTLTADEIKAAKEAGKHFRNRLSELGNTTSGRYEQLKIQYKDVYESFEELRVKNAKDEYVGDLAYESYLKVMYENEGLYDNWGNYDYDAADIALQQWKDEWGGEGTSTYEYVQARLKESRDEPPLLQELRKAREVLRPYWEIKDHLLQEGKYPADATEQQEWVLRDLRIQNPLAAQYYEAMEKLRETDPKAYYEFRRQRYMVILYESVAQMTVPTVESVVDEERLQWRKDHPQYDKYLVMFYDLKPIAERGA